MSEESALKHFTEQEVSKIFSDPESDAAQRWKTYWASTESRNAELMAQFRQAVSLGFHGKTVLDIGCGSAGLATVVLAEGGCYIGADDSPYVLRMGRHWLQQKKLPAHLTRASGCELPFGDECFDYIFAFDVIEHLQQGSPAQLRFLQELRRVIRSPGIIFLTTPNKWHPFEGHTFLYFPQYLPVRLADKYIGRKNPGFLQEHGSFRSIRLLTPKLLQRLLALAELSFLHQLPCCLDVEDLPAARRFIFRLLQTVGLSWYPLQEFWGCLVRVENRKQLRVHCRKEHRIALHESANATQEFASQVDFNCGSFAHQLKDGWFPHETAESSFRWTTDEAELWLQAEGGEDFLLLAGKCNALEQGATLDVYFDSQHIGQHHMTRSEAFRLRFLLPHRLSRLHIGTVRLVNRPCYVPGGSDPRKLGVAISEIALVSNPEFRGRINFNVSPESPELRRGWFAHERDGSGYRRWTARQAEVWLQATGKEDSVLVKGYCNASERPGPVRLRIYCENEKIGEHVMRQNEMFNLRFPLSSRLRCFQLYSIRVVTDPCYLPSGVDKRELGVAIFEMALV